MKKTDEFFKQAFRRPTYQELEQLEREWERRAMTERIVKAAILIIRLVVVGLLVYFLCTVS